jgi:hypothetical protein
MGVDSFNGPMTKREALEAIDKEKPPPNGSWRVEVTDDKGQRWRSGVTLATEEEAEVYGDVHARAEVAGYVTARLIRSDDAPSCSISRTTRRSNRWSLGFMDGECWRMRWHEVTA